MSNPTKAELYGDRDSRPAMLPPVWDGIPDALRARALWVAWELRWKPERESWAKVPLNVLGVSVPDGYAQAKPNDPRTWTTFERVREAWGRTYGTFAPADPAGPGFVFQAGSGFLGIDLDNCRDRDTGELTALAHDVMRRLPGYWEVSPSGMGLKGIFAGAMPTADGKGRRAKLPDGQEIEAYDRGRYFTITGRRVAGSAADVTPTPDTFRALFAEWFPDRPKGPKSERAPLSPRNVSVSLDGLMAKMFAATNGHKIRALFDGDISDCGGDASRADLVLCCHLAFWLDGDAAAIEAAFDTSALGQRSKWQTRPDYRSRTIGRAIEQSSETYSSSRERRPQGYLNLTDAQVNELLRGLGKPSTTSDTTELPADQAVAAVAGQILGDLVDHAPTAPAAEPDECALYAAHDIEAEVALLTTRCQNLRPVLMEKDGRPFVCDRPCGNGTVCRPCLDARLLKKTKEGNAYLVRTTTMPAAGESPRVVYAAVVDPSVKPGTSRWNTLTKKVADRGGERASLLTEDTNGVASRLGRSPEVSGFFLEDNKALEESRLWLLSLPHDAGETTSIAGVTFRRVPAANAMWAWFQAVKTVPDAPEEGTFKPHHQSSEWGDEEAKVPSSVKALRPSKFNVEHTAKILDRLHIESYSVRFDLRQGAEPGVGWVLPGIRSLAMTLWLGGVGAEFVPTVSRVVDLARCWLPMLPAELGKGRRVESLLREHIWSESLYGITEQLRAADEADKAEEEARAEAAELYESLRDSYRGREHEATGLTAELLA